MTASRLPFAQRLRAVGLAAAAALAIGCGAVAQETKPQPAPSGPPPAAQRSYEPGMLASIGRWFQDSFSYLGSIGDRAGAATKNAARGAADAASGAASATAGAAKGTVDAAKDAADAVARLSGTRVVEARERCAVAANGAPDCHRAAENICRARGFSSGSSLNIESERNCPPETWIARRAEPGECKVHSFVTRAVCQ